MSVIRIRVAATAGSAPREAGTEMRVWSGGSSGTIGGGALEWRAMAEARAMLAEGRTALRRTWPLGPALGQCCGGSVTLDFAAVEDRAVPEPRDMAVWVWGAGHVGRAVVGVLAPFPGMALTWADTGPERFPETVPEGVEAVPAADLPRLAAHAPPEAHHLVMTYSHEIDLALCHVLLGHGFASLGLIGSATKWARFRGRLASLGHPPARISRIACPIGDPTLGKHPQAIAVGVAAALMRTSGTVATRDRAG